MPQHLVLKVFGCCSQCRLFQMCMFICPMPHYFQKGLPITRAEDSFVWIWLNLRPLGHPPTWKHELLPKILEWQIASRSYKTDRFTKWSKCRGHFYSLWNLPSYKLNRFILTDTKTFTEWRFFLIILVVGQQVQRSFSFLGSTSCTTSGCVQKNKIKQDWP